MVLGNQARSSRVIHYKNKKMAELVSLSNFLRKIHFLMFFFDVPFVLCQRNWGPTLLTVVLFDAVSCTINVLGYVDLSDARTCCYRTLFLLIRKFTLELQFGRWEVVTEAGSLLRCQHVLVAVGGYAALKPLFQHIKPGMVPKLELRTQTVAYLQIAEDEAHRLRQVHRLIFYMHFILFMLYV